MSELWMYLQLSFVQNAIIVGILISLCTALLGTSLALRGYSFLGMTLSNVSFAAMSLSSVIGIISMPFTLLITMTSSVLLLKNTHDSRNDSRLAMIAIASLAFGYMIMNIFPSTSNISADVCVALFGSISILTLTTSDVIICVLLSIATIIIFVAYYHQIFGITFDSTFMKTSGLSINYYNIIYAILTAIVIVLAMTFVGSLLVSALLLLPCMSSMCIFHSYQKVVISSTIISVLVAIIGMIVSILYSTPVGASVVMIHVIVYIICFIFRKVVLK